MQAPQLELWSAEPHTTPLIYPKLTPSQRLFILPDNSATTITFRCKRT